MTHLDGHTMAARHRARVHGDSSAELRGIREVRERIGAGVERGCAVCEWWDAMLDEATVHHGDCISITEAACDCL